jgi:PmbA protein
MISPQEASALARETVSIVSADGAEVVLSAHHSALTRFANNRINQNVAETNASVSIRAVLGARVGMASTNRLDPPSLRRTAQAAVEAASCAVADESFPGLPGPRPDAAPPRDRVRASTLSFDPVHRAGAVAEIIGPSASHGLAAAGTVKCSHHVLAVANSNGIDTAMALTGAGSTVLSTGAHGNTGWASFVGLDASELDALALGETAASLAERTVGAIGLEPGSYPVVLGPDAVSDILDFLGWTGFSAKAVEEGRSFMSGRLGDKLLDESITIVDDACASHALGYTFDFEGVPKRRVTLVDRGVLVEPVTDSYWAARTGRPDTGHALPAPNSYGPMPLDLELQPGDASIEELIAEVDRGVYVTRFHYVNVEDPVSLTLTGMTRDGTFMIEGGHLTRPLRNLRFTQSVVEALGSCRGITADRRFVGTDESATLVPGMLLASFAFTGQTA